MAISREEAINFLKAYSECEKKKVKGIYEECNVDLCDNCDLCYAQGNLGEHIKATDKAISDMEKLQKIEHIICDIGECEELEDTIEEKMEKHCEYHRGDCNRCMIQRIEQIVEEVE